MKLFYLSLGFLHLLYVIFVDLLQLFMSAPASASEYCEFQHTNLLCVVVKPAGAVLSGFNFETPNQRTIPAERRGEELHQKIKVCYLRSEYTEVM